jgi:hypothetical protein
MIYLTIESVMTTEYADATDRSYMCQLPGWYAIYILAKRKRKYVYMNYEVVRVSKSAGDGVCAYLAGDLTHLAEDAAEQRRLSGADHADHGRQRAGPDLDVYTLQHLMSGFVRLVVPREHSVLHLHGDAVAPRRGDGLPLHRRLVQLRARHVPNNN